MVYSSRFVLSVLAGGHVLPERADGIVVLPFGQEFSLRFRNKNSRRAVVRFTIDGEAASGRGGYVIDGNSAIDIHRWSDRDAAFVFAALESQAAADAGKTVNRNGEKGVIEARFYLEREPVPSFFPTAIPRGMSPQHSGYYGRASLRSSNRGMGQSIQSSLGEEKTSGGIVLPQALNPEAGSAPELQEGCAVAGEATGQQFYATRVNLETDYTVLRLVLRGGELAAPASPESATAFCTGCGRHLRKKDRFCGSCGQSR